MRWRDGTPATPGVYRVREPSAPKWYRRWDGRGWCIGDETPHRASLSTERTDSVLPWCIDEQVAQYNQRAAVRARTARVADMARRGESRYTIASAVGVSKDNYAVRAAVAAVAMHMNKATITALWCWSERARAVSPKPFARSRRR